MWQAPLTTSLRGLWVSGLLPPIPKRKLPNCQEQNKVLQQRWLRCPTAKGRDQRTPASRRHWLLRVVAATAGMVRLDGPGDDTICALFPSIVPGSRHHLHTTQCLVSGRTSYASVYGALRGLYIQFFSEAVNTWETVSRSGTAKTSFDRYKQDTRVAWFV